MNISYDNENKKIIIKDIKNFNVGKTLECGQAFNFEKLDENYYKLTAFKRVLFVKQYEYKDEYKYENKVEMYPTTEEDFNNVWVEYFDLKTDYDEIYNKFIKDEVLKPLVEYGEGIRILKQEKWECLISFIISQNNRIPQIKKCINYFAENYGDKIENGYAFPTPEQLASKSIEELKESKVGFRAKYINDCTMKVVNKELMIEEIANLPREEVAKELLKIKGVGIKVANCVLLFAYAKADAFPVDVWIKRAMEVLYFNGEEQKLEDIQTFAEEKFGEYSGIVQQYIFYYARENELGKK